MRVELSYKFRHWPKLDSLIVDKLGHSESSGAGFGYRDLVYEGRTPAQLRKKLGSLVEDYEIDVNILV